MGVEIINGITIIYNNEIEGKRESLGCQHVADC